MLSVVNQLTSDQTCNTFGFTFVLLCVLLRVTLCLKDFYFITKGHKGQN